MENNAKADPPLARLRHDDYSIAIICPMGHESAPVEALLDEVHQSLPSSRDQNAYTLGRIGLHNIVVAVMPKTGNNIAAMVVTQLRNDFKCIRFGLLVGIGGGIPDEDYEEDNLNDIRLGDVVVSVVRDDFGGVIQFTRGKIKAGWEFKHSGHLNAPPPVLSSNIAKLQALHERQENSITRYLNQMFERYPRMKKNYKCPGGENDILFQADYEFEHEGRTSCRKCDHAKTIQRPDREKGPEIHYGIIGSSDIVIKDSQTRDYLRHEFGILCVEMEAAGLMDAFPGLVIRGICDYADSHKNDKWQRYAAATAAAYAKELLLQIPPADIKKAQTIEKVMDAVGALSARVEENAEIARRVERRQLTEEEENILEWLSPSYLTFSNAQHAARSTHTPGTGHWALKDLRYTKWRDETGGIFWLYGVAGCGKTVLCSTIIHDLQQRYKGSHLAYWYFQFSNLGTQDVCTMLRSLTRQFSTIPLSSTVRILVEEHKQHGSQPSLDELFSVLDEVIRSINDDIFIVLDALDEYPLEENIYGRSTLLKLISSLKSHHLKLHILVTSRPEPDIGSVLRDIAKFRIDIEEFMRDDIARYVETALKQPEFTVWGQEIISHITAKLLSFEERRFRWADLQIRRFKNCPKKDALEDALRTIPKTLEASYQNAFRSISPEQTADVQKIMMWLTSAFRPLTPQEVAKIAGYISPDHVLRICTSLLVTIIDDDTRQTIKLAHFSVKEYLILRRLENEGVFWYQFSSQLAHRTVAIMALDYLLDENTCLCQDDINRIYNLDTFKPLLLYSAKYWPQHAKAHGDVNQLELQGRIDRLFDAANSTQYFNWLSIFNPDDKNPEYIPIMTKQNFPQPLYYASLLGLKDSVTQLSKHISQWKVLEGHYNSALNAAAATGNVEIMQILIQHCNKPAKFIDLTTIAREIQRNELETFDVIFGLDYCITKSIVEVVLDNSSGERLIRLLLDKRADNFQITHRMVKAIASRRDNVTMQLLLERRGGDVHITNGVVKVAAGNIYGSAIMRLLLDRRPNEVHITEDVIMRAAGNEYSGEEVMRLLLGQRPNEVHITEDVIKRAVGNKHSGEEVMWLILDRLPDDVHITRDIVKAIAETAYSPNRMIFLLLDRWLCGAHITTNLLSLIARYFDVEVMQALLGKWPNEVHITEDVVEAAAGNEYGGGMMKLLLDQRPDDIHITKDVVKSAAGNEYGGEEVIRLLLYRRPDNIHVTEDVVKAAATSGCKRNLCILAKKAHIDIKPHLLQCELVKSTKYGDATRVSSLLVDVVFDLGDIYNRSPLWWSVYYENVTVLRLFLNTNNVDVNRQCKINGQTPLIIATIGGEGTIVKLLLEAGADLNIADNDGETPLSLVEDRFDLRHIKKILHNYDTGRSIPRFCE